MMDIMCLIVPLSLCMYIYLCNAFWASDLFMWNKITSFALMVPPLLSLASVGCKLLMSVRCKVMIMNQVPLW